MLHRFTKNVCDEHAFEKAWWMRELMVCQILTVSLLVKSLLDIKTICEHLWTVSCSFHMGGSWKYDWRPPGNCQMLWSPIDTNCVLVVSIVAPVRRCAEFHVSIKQAPGLDTYLQDPMYSVQLIVCMLMIFGGWVTWLSCLNPQGDSGLVYIGPWNGVSVWFQHENVHPMTRSWGVFSDYMDMAQVISMCLNSFSGTMCRYDIQQQWPNLGDQSTRIFWVSTGDWGWTQTTSALRSQF